MRVTINIQRLGTFELWMKNAFLAQSNSAIGHSDTAVSNAARARMHSPGYDTFDSQQGIRLVATIVINVEPIGDLGAALLGLPVDGYLTLTVCGQILGSLKHLASGLIEKTHRRSVRAFGRDECRAVVSCAGGSAGASVRSSRETLDDGLSGQGETDCAASSVGCPALWIGFGLGCSSVRLGACISVLPFASAVYCTCAIRNRDRVLVRRYQWPAFSQLCSRCLFATISSNLK
jgi:hypothetical protein